MRRTLLWFSLLALLAFGAAALAESASVETVAVQAGESYVHYPKLTGMADEAIQGSVNDQLVEKADIASYLVTLSLLEPDGLGLTVDEQSTLHGDLFSTVLSAKGRMSGGREGHVYTALAYDLQTGTQIAPEQLFTAPDEARAWMEERLTATYADELSGYLESGELTPLPMNNFSLDDDGVTFYYPASQFSLLSGYSGACEFHFDELYEFLDLSEDSVLSRWGVKQDALTADEQRERITALLSTGTLPGAKARIGDSVAELVAQYRLLREPDQYPGGRYFQLESAPFRQILLLSDALQKGYDQSVVAGIRSMRCNLFGLATGTATRQEWRDVLGTPESTVVFDEAKAYDYSLPACQADYYTIGEYQLCLFADADDLLYAVQLSK